MIANGVLNKYDSKTRSYSSFILPDLEKTGGPFGYIFKDEDGALYLSGLNYFIRFHPDSIYETSHQPKVFLTDFKIFNDSHSNLLAEKEIRLRYDKNYFSFDESMFVDYSKMNFALKANADVFKKMPEFKAIPFDQIGIRN